MITILEFHDENEADRDKLKDIAKASENRRALWDLLEYLRQTKKYARFETKEAADLAVKIHAEVWNIVTEAGADVE